MLGRIDGYELLERIGEGGAGVVFKAYQPRLDRVVAVKVLLDEFCRDAEYRARFLREARVGASLHHPVIATCFDVGEAALEPADLLRPGDPGPHPDRRLYLVMEYVAGTDLHGLIGERPVPISRVVELLVQTTAGLESAHRSGVVHRDLKSTNIRVTPEGQVKIVDFGLSCIEGLRKGNELPSFITSAQREMGTPHFMAPEQHHGRTTDPRSDLFSLGVITYHLVTGRLPFTGNTHHEIKTAAETMDPPPLGRYASHVPEELQRVVDKLLAKDPEDRYQSAHEVHTDLVRLQARPHDRRPVRVRRVARAVRVGIGVVGVLTAAGLAIVGARWVLDRWGAWSAGSVAVVPFHNLTGDPRFDDLCYGLASGVVGELVNRARLNVASLSSVGPRDSAGTARTVAARLGVDAVLEGALRRQAGITYLDVQLVDSRRNLVRWASRYPYALEEGDEIQTEIVRQVVGRLGGRQPDTPSARRSPTPGLRSATDLCLRAAARLDDPDNTHGMDEALELYARALEADPEFALAWAGQSQALVKIYRRDKDPAALYRAEEAANRANQLRPEMLEARLARAQVFRFLGRHGAAIRELQQVLRINPNWDEAHLQLAACYRDSGDYAHAKISARRAIALRPDYWRNWDVLGALMARGGEYDSARVAFEREIRLAPGENLGYTQLAAVELRNHNYAAAMTLYDQLPEPVDDGATLSNMASAYFFGRRPSDARRHYVRALALEPKNHDLWRNLGDVHAQEGKADSARADYVQAVRLIEDQLHLDPMNVRLRLYRALCLAKTGDCAAARGALADIATVIPEDDADCAHWLAQLYAICQQREAALLAVRRAVRLGFPRQSFQVEDEFAGLAADPRFLAVTASPAP